MPVLRYGTLKIGVESEQRSVAIEMNSKTSRTDAVLDR